MSLWRQLTRGLRVLVQRDAADRDVSDEVAVGGGRIEQPAQPARDGLERHVSPYASRRRAIAAARRSHSRVSVFSCFLPCSVIR